ncbi:hypothetical protein [Lysobacter sp. CA199]|uniref:hypothetical protein n=1 Tax=Lysobacter sp. CA199 TaxID=3455608 RepID=UPI003F8D4013
MKTRISDWKAAFETDEQAVLPTLNTFAWNYAAFSSIAEVVRRAPETESGGKRLNAMVMDLVVAGYWSSSFLAIRRLVEPGKLRGPDGVNSLRAIIQDVRRCRNELNRRVFVEDIAGFEYDFAAVMEKSKEFARAQTESSYWVPREFNYELSIARHAEFDWLSGTSPESRRPDDLIRNRVFQRLDARLDRLDSVAVHATKYFAHAANEASRDGNVLEKWGLREALEALKLLTQTAELVGRWFCGSGAGIVLPTPQYDQFEFLDQPMYEGDGEALAAVWDEISSEIDEWPRIRNEDL